MSHLESIADDATAASGSPATPHAGAQPESLEASGPSLDEDKDRRDQLIGIAAMVVTIFAFSVMDVIGKWVVKEHSVFQRLAVRSSVAVVILFALLPFMGGRHALRTKQPWMHALRAVFGIGAFILFFAGLRALPLADGVTVAFGSPFILTALSVPILRERVTARQWAAVALGFVGVLLIVRPQASGIRPEALLVMAASVCYALSMILTRLMTRGERSSERSFAFVFYTLGGQALVGWAVAAFAWQRLDGRDLGLMAAMGVLGVIGNFGLTIAFRRARVGVVAPFEYTALLWATLFGYVVFGDFPGVRVWFGAALIVAAGIYAVRRSGG